MKEPLISVIIPVYNTEKYLNQCLSSVIQQTYKNLEIIVIDDGSTDNSPDIIKNYADKDSRIKVITKKNEGQSVARNFGIDISTGDWITFIDSDDWIDIDCYQEFVNTINNPSIPDYDIFMFNGASFEISDYNPNDIKLKEFYSFGNYKGKTDEFGGKTISFNDCINPFKGNLAVYNKIFKSDFLKSNNFKFKEGLVFQDSLFWIEAFLKGRVHVTEQVFYYYRQQPNSTQHSISEKVFNLIEITNLIKQRLKENNFYQDLKEKMFDYKIQQYAWFFFTTKDNIKSKFYKEAKEDLIKEINLDFSGQIPFDITNKKLLISFINMSDREFFEEFVSKYDKTKPQKHLEYFCIHLVGECNLKCKGCDHFAPLASGEYLTIEGFEKDFKRLSELTNGMVEKIGLMGGEPLLHPLLTDFFPIARKYFPNTIIQLVTNGILLNNQQEAFWNSCKENNIIIMVTKYPLKLDYEKMEETAQKYGVILSYYNNPNVEKMSYKIPLDIEGKQTPELSHKHCFHANKLCFLSQGYLYPCTVAPNVYRFNERFGQNIPTENNGISIYETETEKELMEFLSKPIPMCKYCNVKNREFELDWELSKQKIDEWIVSNDTM